MSLFDSIDKMKQSSEKDETKLTISIGRVMDTNDPMQMGRIRVYVPGLDHNYSTVGDIPFALYCSPLAGHQQVQSRGPVDNTYTQGPVAYGMFNIPKVGTDVLIACLDGNPNQRIWFGAIFGAFLTSTLPHGRFSFKSPFDTAGTPDGPLSATEQPIQPIYDNLTTTFERSTAVASNDGAIGLDARINFEWRSRGLDYQAASLGNIQRTNPSQNVSNLTDDRNVSFTEEDGTAFKQGQFTQGYALSQIEPNVPYDPTLVDTGQNFDPQTYSWTTPGFHSISLDDRPENCRIRMRTTSGHQILLDDTNERIYIATAKGENWIEMDQKGNIDIYTSGRLSCHAESDINFTTGGSFRVNATSGIHLVTGGDIRLSANQDISLISLQSIRANSTSDILFQSEANIQALAGSSLILSSTQNTEINATGSANITTQQSMNLLAQNNILTQSTTGTIQLNGPTPSTAAIASASNATEGYFTNRVPEHEPYGRIMMLQTATDNDSGNSFQLELNYDSPQVGRVEFGVPITRNPRWHR